MVQAVGNTLTIVGILVTFVAYFGQHSGVSLVDLEPKVVAQWYRSRAWVRKRLGRTKTITVGLNAVLERSVAMPGTILVWNQIQPGDDIAVRTDKLARNLDALRVNINQGRAEDRKQQRETAQKLTERLHELDQTVARRDAESRQAATSAMRWEVRGLLITLVGAGLGIFG